MLTPFINFPSSTIRISSLDQGSQLTLEGSLRQSSEGDSVRPRQGFSSDEAQHSLLGRLSLNQNLAPVRYFWVTKCRACSKECQECRALVAYTCILGIHEAEIRRITVQSQLKQIVLKTLSRKYSTRGWGQGGEMTQALYAHMNNKTIKKENPKDSMTISYN
jgi:hypothetical protein